MKSAIKRRFQGIKEISRKPYPRDCQPDHSSNSNYSQAIIKEMATWGLHLNRSSGIAIYWNESYYGMSPSGASSKASKLQKIRSQKIYDTLTKKVW